MNTDFLPRDSWRSALLSESSNLQQAISNLDSSALQIVLVIADDGTFAGTLTDGDIRRGLLRGLTLASPIRDIVHRNAIVVPPQWSREMALPLMTANNIRQLPVVDEHHHVVGLHLWDDMKTASSRRNVLVVMAGGKGSRLRPHTENCPKPMLPVGGKPMLEHIIERAKLEGITHFVLAIHYLGHMIEEYFGDGSRWQVRIDYVRETSPLGTAGALALMSPRPTDSILVTNGDLMTDFHYGELLDFHKHHNTMATMAVRLHEYQNPFGVVHTNGVDIIGFEEKPISRSHISAGIYVIEPRALDLIGENEYCDMPTLFARLRESAKRTIVFPMHEPWLDVGRPTDLEMARKVGNT